MIKIKEINYSSITVKGSLRLNEERFLYALKELAVNDKHLLLLDRDASIFSGKEHYFTTVPLQSVLIVLGIMVFMYQK